jgi:hypothetical protein
VAQHYGGLFLFLDRPGSWENSSFTLSTLGNFTDFSFVSRLDYRVRVLSHLFVEVYAAGHYGKKGGELRFALDLPASMLDGAPIPAISIPPPLFEAGFGLRVNL